MCLLTLVLILFYYLFFFSLTLSLSPSALFIQQSHPSRSVQQTFARRPVLFSLSVTFIDFYVPCRSLIFLVSRPRSIFFASAWIIIRALLFFPPVLDMALSHLFQVFRERLKVLHSKITARNERIKLLMQRGSPDVDPLDSVET